MRKVCIIHMIGLWVPVLLAAQSALGDAGGDLKQAEGLCKAGKYAQAEQVCRRVLQNEPNNPEAVYQAGKMLPQVYLAAGQLPQAKEAVKDLLARSAKHEYLPHAVHEMIEQAKPIGKTAQAGQICRDLLNAGVQPSQAIWLKMGIALADVYGGNDQAVDAEARGIIAANGADPGAAEALAQIGWAYVKLGQDKKARPLYEYVVQNWSGKPRAMHAHTALVRSCIRLNDKEAAASQVQSLAKQYREDPELPKVLNEIARGYRGARMYGEARNVSQYVLDNYPGHEQRIWADRDLILCDVVQQRQDDAQAGLQKLTRDHASNSYLPLVLGEIADQYRQGRKFKEAKALWQYVLDNYPSSGECLWAQRDIVLSDIALKDMNAVSVGTRTLLTKYAGQSGIWWAVQDIADSHSKVGQHELARDLYQLNLTNYPNVDDTIWSLRGVINECIALKDQDAANDAIKKLMNDYADSPGLPMAAVHVGTRLYETGDSRALQLFQYVVDRFPAHEQAPLAQVRIGHVHIRQGQDAQAEALYQQVLAKYANFSTLPEAACLMGEGYYERATAQQVWPRGQRDPNSFTQRMEAGLAVSARQDYSRAIEKWEMMIRTLPENADATPRAYHLAGESYRQLGQTEKAIECFQKVCERWPAYRYAGHLQLSVALLYRNLVTSGRLTESDAAPKIEDALRSVICKYPECPAARAAGMLQRQAILRKGGVQ